MAFFCRRFRWVIVSTVVAVGVSTALGRSAAAQAVSVRAELSSRQVALGEGVQLDITVEGAQNVQAPQITLPDAVVRYMGPSTLMSIVNGQMSSAVTHRYSVFPQKTGTLAIPPINITVGKEVYHTQPVALEVLAAGTAPSPGLSSGGGQSISDAPALGDALQLKIGLDKRSAYVNEPIKTRVQLLIGGAAVRDIEPPTLAADGFLVKPFDPPRQSDVFIDNQRYILIEFDTELVPIRPGTLDIGPASLNAQVIARTRSSRRHPSSPLDQDPFEDMFNGSLFDQFFGGTQVFPVSVRANPVTIEVLPLPQEGKPASFTGAVGQFQMDVRAVPQQAAVGEPITLTARIAGQGNFDAVKPPQLSGNTKAFKTYEPTVKKNADTGGTHVKTFEQVLIPLTAGVTALPAVEFSYFDPEAKQYRMLRQDPLPITVTEAAHPTQARVIDNRPASPAAPVAVVGEDIAYIKERIGRVTPRGWRWYRLPFVGFAFILPLAFFSIALGSREWAELRSRRAQGSSGGRALDRALALCREAERMSSEGRVREAYAAVFRALQYYLGNRFHLSAESLTRDELEVALRSRGAPEALLNEVSMICDRCDSARFGSPDALAAQLPQTLHATETLLRRLDNWETR